MEVVVEKKKQEEEEEEEVVSRRLLLSRSRSSYRCTSRELVEEEDDDVALPGFRFHPTDEELVGFYLRRKVEKKPISIELIKQIDIYKYDPWDLPKSSNVGDKEWYFFCRRGRKYRNSIRPNRVTGSGFWKATGIDRPIYSSSNNTAAPGSGSGSGSVCIGLKKSLVYYRGSAGKGTKTDWMMHEFRLPPATSHQINHNTMVKHMDDKLLAQEAEVWTLCRILKRNVCQRKTLPEWRQVSGGKRNPVAVAVAVDASSKTCSGTGTGTGTGDNSDHDIQSYISFQAPTTIQQAMAMGHEKKPFAQAHYSQQQHQHQHRHDHDHDHVINVNGTNYNQQFNVIASAPYSSSFSNLDANDHVLKHGDNNNNNWDDLRSVVEFAATDPFFFM